MSRYRRWNELLELLSAAGELQVEDAAKALNVSAATIRRDFDELASQQMLTRIRGGAVAQGVNYDLPLRYKTERHPSEKQRIGELAAEELPGIGRYTYVTYIGLKVLAHAMEQCGKDLTRSCTIDKLRQTKDYDTGGLSAPVSFDNAQQLSGTAVAVYQLDAKTLKFKPLTEFLKY